jgi:hypothetical protein
MFFRPVGQFRILVEECRDGTDIACGRRGPYVCGRKSLVSAQHFARAGVERAVIVMRIVIAQAGDLDKRRGQVPVGGLHRDFQLRPTRGPSLARENEVTFAQAKCPRLETGMSCTDTRYSLCISASAGLQ